MHLVLQLFFLWEWLRSEDARESERKKYFLSAYPDVSGCSSLVNDPVRIHRDTLGDTAGLDFDQLQLACYVEEMFRAYEGSQDAVDDLTE